MCMERVKRTGVVDTSAIVMWATRATPAAVTINHGEATAGGVSSSSWG